MTPIPARLLDYYDALLAGELPAGSSLAEDTFEAPKFDSGGALLLDKKAEDKEIYLWAIDRLRRQIIGMGAKPVVALPE